MISVIIAPLMLVLVIIFITVGKMNRLLAAFIGAITVAFFLLYVDNIDITIVVGFLIGTDNSNLQTILFIFGMMMTIAVCEKSGVFSYIAFRLVQMSKGKSRRILIILCFFTFIFSSVTMNILCIFLIIPLTITICRILKINPLPFILSEGMVVNLGGLLFVISSIPNLLISHAINWTFPEYFIDVGFFSIYLFVINIIFLTKYNERKLETAEPNYIKRLLDYDPWMFVASKKNFYKSLVILLLTILSVIILPLFFPITIDVIALAGGIISVLLVLLKKFDSVWKSLDLELIFYLFCILVMSEAIDFTGVLSFVSNGIEFITGGNPFSITILLLWLSSILSSVVHNAPITKIFIPVVQNVSTAQNQRVFFSALTIGTVLGENLSVMGDNLVLILMVRSKGYKLTFSTFMKLGIITTMLELIASSFFLVMKVSIQFLFIGIIILLGIVVLLLFLPKILKWEKVTKMRNLRKNRLIRK